MEIYNDTRTVARNDLAAWLRQLADQLESGQIFYGAAGRVAVGYQVECELEIERESDTEVSVEIEFTFASATADDEEEDESETDESDESDGESEDEGAPEGAEADSGTTGEPVKAPEAGGKEA